MSVRAEFVNLLTEWTYWEYPQLNGVRIVGTEGALDEIEEVTALVRTTSIGRDPSAPMSARRVELLLTLISPHLDLDVASEQIEELADSILNFLGGRFQHGPASIVFYGNRLALDIPVTVIAVDGHESELSEPFAHGYKNLPRPTQ